MGDEAGIGKYYDYVAKLAAKLNMSPEELLKAVLDVMFSEGLVRDIIEDIVLKEPSCVRDKGLRIRIAIRHAVYFGLEFYKKAIRPALEEVECLGDFLLEDPDMFFIDDEGRMRMTLVAPEGNPYEHITGISIASYVNSGPDFLRVEAFITLDSEEELRRLKANVKRVNEEIFAEEDYDFLEAEITNINIDEGTGEIWVDLVITAQDEYLPSIKWLADIIDKEIVGKSKLKTG